MSDKRIFGIIICTGLISFGCMVGVVAYLVKNGPALAGTMAAQAEIAYHEAQKAH